MGKWDYLLMLLLLYTCHSFSAMFLLRLKHLSSVTHKKITYGSQPWITASWWHSSNCNQKKSDGVNMYNTSGWCSLNFMVCVSWTALLNQSYRLSTTQRCMVQPADGGNLPHILCLCPNLNSVVEQSRVLCQWLHNPNLKHDVGTK